MRWTTISLLPMVLAGCSLPTGVSFRCESDGACPDGLRCVALDAGRYCLDVDGGAAGAGTAGGGVAGGGTSGGGTSGGGTSGGGTSGGGTSGGGTSGGGTSGGGTSGGGTSGGGTSGGGTSGGGTSGGGTSGGGTSGGGTSGGGIAGGGTSGCGAPLDLADTLYVSVDGGSDSNSGVSPTAPFATVTHALTRAVSLGRSVIAVAPGVYSEPVVIGSAHAGRTVTGGFLADWTRDCAADARDRTVIDAPAGVGIAFSSISGPEVIVRRMTVRSGPTAQKGGSTYGVRALASNVSLHDVVVIAEPASEGRMPASPVDMTGTTLCLGVSDCSTGGAGSRGAAGRSADGGWFDAMGFLPGVGETGTPGGPGFNGTPPPLPVPANCATCSGSTPCNGSNLFCGNTTGAMSGTRGRCGCGGLGGLGAAGGIGGGASIALFASGSSLVRVTNSVLRSRAGGAGVGGAFGGLGSLGSSGARGNPTACIDPNGANCSRMRCNDNCEPSGQVLAVAGGADGGTGGTGGAGGPGGAGAGGPSIGVVSVFSTVTLTASTVNTGFPGPAADGGQPGFSQQTLTIP
ncbi:MAG: hypothetical protein Q8N26_06545 [Myxococcales bacterium]|nr:hypothetical protein [Myxococcales bacterium]